MDGALSKLLPGESKFATLLKSGLSVARMDVDALAGVDERRWAYVSPVQIRRVPEERERIGALAGFRFELVRKVWGVQSCGSEVRPHGLANSKSRGITPITV